METRDRRDAARLEIGQARRIQAGLPNFSGTVPEFSQFKVSYRVDSCIKPWGRPGHKRRLAYLTPTIDKVRVPSVRWDHPSCGGRSAAAVTHPHAISLGYGFGASRYCVNMIRINRS